MDKTSSIIERLVEGRVKTTLVGNLSEEFSDSETIIAVTKVFEDFVEVVHPLLRTIITKDVATRARDALGARRVTFGPVKRFTVDAHELVMGNTFGGKGRREECGKKAQGSNRSTGNSHSSHE